MGLVMTYPTLSVSVPIRGLFNLTCDYEYSYKTIFEILVSVPIRGLFNLTVYTTWDKPFIEVYYCFRPHQGII